MVFAEVIDCTTIDEERVKGGCTFELKCSASFLVDIALAGIGCLLEASIQNKRTTTDVECAATCSDDNRLRGGHIGSGTKHCTIVELNFIVHTAHRAVGHTIFVGHQGRHEYTSTNERTARIGMCTTHIYGSSTL